MTDVTFHSSHLLEQLEGLDDAALDALAFGVIAFDADGKVERYNAAESQFAGLARPTVIGSHLFEVVAPCMNNFMVAERYVEAAAAAKPLDATIDYILTFRMRPTRVQLRMMSEPAGARRYLAVQRAMATGR